MFFSLIKATADVLFEERETDECRLFFRMFSSFNLSLEETATLALKQI